MAPNQITEEKLGLGKGLYAVFETTQGEIVIMLEDEKAPETVKNFVGLATGEKEYTDAKTGKKSHEPYYDGTLFHRIIKNFMIQGGDRLGTGTGGPGFTIRDEIHPALKHSGPGILSMAKTSAPHTGGSQFFITLGPAAWLDNVHAVFGHVVRGMEIVTQLGSVATGPQDRPREEVGIKKLRIVKEV